MSTYTLLELTQAILSAMDSDEVNSISDTVESDQVAHLIKGVYYDLATDLGLPEHETLFELTASGDNAKPTLMTLPSTVYRINWVKYNNKLTADTYSHYKDVTYIPFKQFLEMQNSLTGVSTGVGSMTFTNNSESFEIMYRSDRFPLYYTTPDDYTLLFDSYNSDEDTTLQKSKTMVSGMVYPTFSLTDSYTPDLNPQQFSLLLNTAKARAFYELKQVDNPDARREARRQKVINQYVKRRNEKVKEIFKAPRYGR